MVGSLDAQEVLLLGAGRVGQAAALKMVGRGAHIKVFDIDKEAAASLTYRIEEICPGAAATVDNLEKALDSCRLLFDASPAINILKPRHFKKDLFISSPGMPLCLPGDFYQQLRERLVHDPLQLGVAAMICQVL